MKGLLVRTFMISCLIGAGWLFGAPQAVASVGWTGPGYWLEAGDGGVFSFGSAAFHGSAAGRCTSLQCYGFTATPSGSGYWIADNYPPAFNGQIYGFGSVGDVATGATNVTAVASTPSGHGGWVLSGDDGAVKPFGDAAFYGDGTHILFSERNLPPQYGFVPYFEGIVATPDGGGYWLVGADGGVFSYGDARFFGSMGGRHVNAPVCGMARTTDGNGYWLVAYDGGVFAFGDARFQGSMGGKPLNELMIAIAANPDGTGYWTAAQDGGVFAFGDAPFLGSMGDKHLNRPVYGIAASP